MTPLSAARKKLRPAIVYLKRGEHDCIGREASRSAARKPTVMKWLSERVRLGCGVLRREMSRKEIRRKLLFAHRRLREWRMITKGLLSTSHPVLAHLIVIRRCNLSCAYCNEFDDYSKPVPTGELFRRIDRLASFGTTIITISGGEPLLHPDLDDIIRRIRQRGILAGLITNGYLLTAERIERLNRAGLEHLQISIDNVKPDEVSKKSLKVLDRKLLLLAQYADFHVNINSVVGGGVHARLGGVTCLRHHLVVLARPGLGLRDEHQRDADRRQHEHHEHGQNQRNPLFVRASHGSVPQGSSAVTLAGIGCKRLLMFRLAICQT